MKKAKFGWIGSDLFLLGYYAPNTTHFRGVFTSRKKAERALQAAVKEGGIYSDSEYFEITRFVINRLDGIDDDYKDESLEAA